MLGALCGVGRAEGIEPSEDEEAKARAGARLLGEVAVVLRNMPKMIAKMLGG